MKCPHCGGEINPAALLGGMTSPAKAEAARANAKLGGWPKGRKRGKTKRVVRRQNVPVRRAASASPPVAGAAIPDWKRRLPVNNNGNPPLTWEGPNGPCEEKHGDQCQCVKCAGPNNGSTGQEPA